MFRKYKNNMAKAIKKADKPKPKKKVSKYDKKIKINGSFDEVLRTLSNPIK